MPSILNMVLWLPKQVLYSHYCLYVHLSLPRSRLNEIERRCDAMHTRLFGDMTGD